jgi:hypothetical protein
MLGPLAGKAWASLSPAAGPSSMRDGAGALMDLNSVCDQHGHTPNLPDEPLGAHVLAVAIRAVETAL